jgi:phosphoserine aminotransferase
MANINKEKSQQLYSEIDNSELYSNQVNPKYRSWMNVPFVLADDRLDKLFLEKSYNANLLALKGHKAVGGMRASIYNAMPMEGINALVEFMSDFEKQYG